MVKARMHLSRRSIYLLLAATILAISIVVAMLMLSSRNRSVDVNSPSVDKDEGNVAIQNTGLAPSNEEMDLDRRFRPGSHLYRVEDKVFWGQVKNPVYPMVQVAVRVDGKRISYSGSDDFRLILRYDASLYPSEKSKIWNEISYDQFRVLGFEDLPDLRIWIVGIDDVLSQDAIWVMLPDVRYTIQFVRMNSSKAGADILSEIEFEIPSNASGGQLYRIDFEIDSTSFNHPRKFTSQTPVISGTLQQTAYNASTGIDYYWIEDTIRTGISGSDLAASLIVREQHVQIDRDWKFVFHNVPLGGCLTVRSGVGVDTDLLGYIASVDDRVVSIPQHPAFIKTLNRESVVVQLPKEQLTRCMHISSQESLSGFLLICSLRDDFPAPADGFTVFIEEATSANFRPVSLQLHDGKYTLFALFPTKTGEMRHIFRLGIVHVKSGKATYDPLWPAKDLPAP